MKQNLVLVLDAKQARLPDQVLASIRTSFSTPAARSRRDGLPLEPNIDSKPRYGLVEGHEYASPVAWPFSEPLGGPTIRT
jgi:hypothetical protein